eukprot:3030443-Pleurochrysis_carterae.AAC.2
MHAAVSSESAASEKDVECGTGARKAVQDRGAGRRECSSASRGAALEVEPQSKSKSVRTARGTGLGWCNDQAGVVWRSVACVRGAGARGRSVIRDRKRSRNTIGSDASAVRSRRGSGGGVPLSQSCFVPIAIAVPNAAMFRRIESIAQVENWCERRA